MVGFGMIRYMFANAFTFKFIWSSKYFILRSSCRFSLEHNNKNISYGYEVLDFYEYYSQHKTG